MATAAKPRGYKERKIGTATAPTLHNHSNFSSDSKDSTLTLQLQFLAAKYSVVGGYAVLIAALAWGGRGHG